MLRSKSESNTAGNGYASGNRLSRHKLRAVSTAAVLAAAIGLTGCSWTFLPDSSSDNGSLKFLEDDIQTGSITPAKGTMTPIVQLKNLDEEDWRRAKAALSVALDPHGSTDRVLWDNPKTMAKGSFVSDGPPFVKNDEICRNFKTAVTDQAETRNLQGVACRPSGGEWDIIEINTPAKSKAVAGKQEKIADAASAGTKKDQAEKPSVVGETAEAAP